MKRIIPKQGQESVWDYPRPPKLEPFSGHIRVIFNNQIIIDTHDAYRVLETSHPPVYYLPLKDFVPSVLKSNPKTSFCEFKGIASYVDIVVGHKEAIGAAWFYPTPNQNFAAIKDHLSVYAQYMDQCLVNDEEVQAQEGDFYGGWITKNIVGPFKGGPDTWGW